MRQNLSLPVSKLGYRQYGNGNREFVVQGNAADTLAFFLGSAILIATISSVSENRRCQQKKLQTKTF